MTQLRRTAASAAAYNLDCELLSPDEAFERYPVMRIDDLVGAIWLPADGKANPTDLTMALAKGARLRGAKVVEHVRVLDVLTDGAAVTGVRTDAGDIEAEIVVNCAGQWAKAIGAMAGVNVPLYSAEHFYVVTETIAGVHPDLPILRDPDGYTYFKEEVGGLVIGGFEPEAKPWVAPDKIPYPFEFQLLEEDWEHFEILMENALLRIPALEHTGLKKLYNGPESFTPDNQFILGEAPECANFFVGAGFNSVGIASAGGAGGRWPSGSSTAHPPPISPVWTSAASPRSTATWPGCTTGSPRCSACTTRSPGPTANSPPRARSAARRCTTCWSAANANFGSRMGWERANFFAPDGAEPVIEYSWGKQNWLPWSAAEQVNTRSNVTVFDQTSFSKYLLTGPGAEQALQWLCTADMAVPVGKSVYTGMLNERGTYESDVTVTRTGAQEFLIVSSAATTERDKDHIRKNMPAGAQRRTGRRDVVDGGVRRDGPEVARSAGRPDRRRPVRRGVPVRHQPGRSRWATRRCGPPGSPMSANWVGSSTFPRSSPSGSTRTC